MSSQFIHIAKFGERPRAGRKAHENAYDILDEAARLPGSAPHVLKPRPPVVLFGISPASVRVSVAEFAKTAHDRRGARLRKDGTILYAIVASYPIEWRHLRREEELELYKQWLELVVEWLKSEFGDRLQSVVEHTDENRPHVHAFVIPQLCPLNRIDHRLHPGHAARESVLRTGADRLAGEQAYREGMRSWQDAFYKAVSLKFGHDRISSRRKRFRRDVALMRSSSDRFIERAETIMAHLAQQIDTHPTAQMSGDRAQIEAMLEIFRCARSRLLSGRFDALEFLDSALDGHVGTDVASSGAGDAQLASGDLIEGVQADWQGHDPSRSDELDVADYDDDPDPGGHEDRNVDDDEGAHPEDNFEREVQGSTDEIDPDPEPD